MEEVVYLESNGALEEANAKVEELFNSSPDDLSLGLLYASHKLRFRPHEVVQDAQIGGKVDAALEKCISELSIQSEVEKKQLSAALGLKGMMQSRLMGDMENAALSFDQSLRHNPENIDTLYFYATMLDEGLKAKESAVILYEKILELNDQHVATMNNLAAVLIEISRTEKDAHTKALHLGKAKELLTTAQYLAPGFPAYNLACIAATENNEQECQMWLAQAKQTGGIPDPNMLVEDDDFKPFLEKPWFQAFVKSLGPDYAVEFLVNDGDDEEEDTGFVIEMNVPEGRTCRGDDDAGYPVGVTGYTVWNAAYVTLRWLQDRIQSEDDKEWGASIDWWKGKRVMDLSGGLGLLGLAAGYLGAETVITEVGNKQLMTVAGNIERNTGASDNVNCCELKFGDTETLAQLGTFDVVFASDLLYIGIRDNILPLLGETLKHLLTSNPNCRVILAFEERKKNDENDFLEQLKITVPCNVHAIQVKKEYFEDVFAKDVDDEGELLSGLTFHEDPTVHIFELQKL